MPSSRRSCREPRGTDSPTYCWVARTTSPASCRSPGPDRPARQARERATWCSSRAAMGCAITGRPAPARFTSQHSQSPATARRHNNELSPMQQNERILIVGGDTAACKAAAILARLFQGLYQNTLVESEEIGTIGVGEATTPAIKKYNELL